MILRIAAVAFISLALLNVGRAQSLNSYPETLVNGSDYISSPPVSSPSNQLLLRATPIPLPTPAPAPAYPAIRVAYIIPANRTAQPNAVASLKWLVVSMQSWMRDQMVQWGHGPMTFDFEKESDGTPKIYTFNSVSSDADIRADIWTNGCNAAVSCGVPLWAEKQIWILIPEVHVQSSDSTISGGVALGGSWGSGNDGGTAMVGSAFLPFLSEAALIDNRAYNGLIIPEIGPYPFKSNITFPWFEGSTISALSSTYIGAIIHELTHAFGMPHDFRNDSLENGVLMGNGFRAIRGCFYPKSYSTNYTSLSRSQADALSLSRYFTKSTAETTKPIVSNPQNPWRANGFLHFPFTASDTSGLAMAYLQRGGNTVGDMKLSGTSGNFVMTIPDKYDSSWTGISLLICDVNGNRSEITTTYGFDTSPYAPISHIKVTKPTGLPNRSVQLDASLSLDPDGTPSTMKIEWDLNGDGVFDTAPTTNMVILTTAPNGNSVVKVTARLTDASGLSSVSQPISITSHFPNLTLLPIDSGRVSLQFNSRVGFSYVSETSANLVTWMPNPTPYSGNALLSDVGPFIINGNRSFYRVTFFEK